jgi:hypothetical protein
LFLNDYIYVYKARGFFLVIITLIANYKSNTIMTSLHFAFLLQYRRMM